MLVALLMLASTPPPVRLEYVANDTACPPRERLVGAVSARLGLDPFGEDASDVVEVKVRRVRASLEALVVRRGASGELGRRALSSPTTDCTELFRALELAVAIAIDPRAGLVLPPPRAVMPVAPTPAQVVTQPMRAEDKGAHEEVAPPQPPDFLLGVGITGTLGNGPGPTAGLTLLGGFRTGGFGLELSGRAELPSGMGLALAGQRISTQAFTGDLAVCLALSVVRACAFGALGGLRVTSEGLSMRARPEWTVLALAGARIAGQWSLGDRFILRPFLEVGATLARTTVIVDGAPVWSSSPVVGSLGLVLAVGQNKGRASPRSVRSVRAHRGPASGRARNELIQRPEAPLDRLGVSG